MSAEIEKQNVMDALERGRTDWLEADTDIDRERQMIAIDSLLDVAVKAGYLATKSAEVKSPL